jgi:Protein involved in biosynthesis of mitomycin antibiotics/polyketide fumonisin
MLRFNRSHLPLDQKMQDFWDINGFLIIEDFYTHEECDKLIYKSEKLIDDFDADSVKSIFDTKNQNHVEDKYFLQSGDKIRFFFEDKAFDSEGNLVNDKKFVINKIGHALHDLDEDFYNFSHRSDLDDIAKKINISKPLLLQSMYIFKQPNIGGEVVCHQDSTFLYTEPESAVGFWVALEDATIDNGCLWVAPGGHKGPLRKLFTKIDNVMTLKTLDNTPFEETTTPLEVKKGSLVLLHGRLPHYSSENTSNKSRHAYTLHVIDGNCKYSSNNWLQRSSMPLKGFI